MIVSFSLVGIPVLTGMLLLLKLIAPRHRIFRPADRPFGPGIFHLMILVVAVACDYWASFPEVALRRNPLTMLMFGCDLAFLVLIPTVGSFRALSLFGWLGVAMLADVALLALMAGLTLSLFGWLGVAMLADVALLALMAGLTLIVPAH